MTLAVLLSHDQVAAACRLHGRMDGWRNIDAALLRLREQMPGFEPEVCLLKCVAVNALYGTQVLAIVRMAQHVCYELDEADVVSAESGLVGRIAKLPDQNGNPGRRTFVSFAAKFCHFFVDEERFPIYDEAARRMLALHLGNNCVESAAEPYAAFCKNVVGLRAEAELRGQSRELDRYLWIAGMYERWLRQRKKGKPQVNAELLRLFENPSGADKADLDVLLPVSFERVFKNNS